MGSIFVSGVSKAYKHYSSRWARLAQWLLPGSKERYTNKWVLQGIDFSVDAGQALGIIGMNGAGKSTLLKIITGTTRATTGSVRLHGRVAALLELGLGFHPDFTGRQNALMAGQLLGMTANQVLALMPQIEAFAEIGSYIDEPVRVYSSGMQVRLAFSVATCIRPDILIVDEALSVGDAYFQHKSFDRIRQFRDAGTTLLLVSHDKSAIQALCDRAILLNQGQLAMEGSPEAVMDYYNAMLSDFQNQQVRQEVLSNGKVQTTSGTGEATVEQVLMLDGNGNPLEVVQVGQAITLRIIVKARFAIDRLVLGYGIKDRLGQVIFGTNTDLTHQALENVRAGQTVGFDIAFHANLGPGTYSIQTALVSSQTHLENNYEWRDLALIFSVVNSAQDHFAGCAWLPPTIQIQT